MPLPFQDSFVGASGILSNPPWTQAGLIASTLNYDGGGNAHASANDPADDVIAYDNSNTYSNDQYAEVVIGAVGLVANTHYAKALVRCSGTGASFQGYDFSTDGSSGVLHTIITKWVGGSSSPLTNLAITFALGDTMKIAIISNVITVYKNGVQVGTFTDNISPIASGAPGCGVYQNNGAVDMLLASFEGGNAVASGQAPAEHDAYLPMAAPAPGPNLLIY